MSTPTEQVLAWLADFGAALERGNTEAAAALFHEESYWRDLVACLAGGPLPDRAGQRRGVAEDSRSWPGSGSRRRCCRLCRRRGKSRQRSCYDRINGGLVHRRSVGSWVRAQRGQLGY
jgi:hypothetical protein